jgi:hypothetical protein
MRVRAHARRAVLTLAVSAASVLALGGVAGAAAPAPCNGLAQITDATGDGHHPSSDVLSAWLSEASGHLQAVVQVHAGDWKPEHTDADINGSGFAVVFTLAGHTSYLRALAAPDGTMTYDYGTWNGSFVPAGTTTGSVVYGVGGTATIDVPAALGAGPGAVLADPFVITYDGIIGGVPTWVDHAPGGTLPNDAARGADYVVGSCTALGAGGGGLGAIGGGATGAGAGAAGTVASVALKAPTRLVGGGTATFTGRIFPARAGIDVAVARRGAVTTTSHTRTAADGSFKVVAPVRETVSVRATAAGRRSTTLIVTVASKVRVHVKRLAGGFVRVDGTYAPGLPGKALLLGRFSARPTATRSIRNGRFSFRLRRSRAPRGGLQVVVVPAKGRAERATSNTVSIGG